MPSLKCELMLLEGPEWVISHHDKAVGDITWFITIPGADFKEAVDGNRKVQNKEILVSHWPRVHREEGLVPSQLLSKQGIGPQGPSSEDSEGYPSSRSEYNPEEE